VSERRPGVPVLTLARLGWRLLRVADRRRTTSMVLVVVGTAAAVLSALVGLSVFTVVDARQSRAEARSFRSPENFADARMWVMEQYYPWRNRVVVRVDIALSTDTALSDALPPPAPGLPRWPRPGEAFTSPAYAREAARHPELASYAPGRVVGTVGPAGLRGPDELLVYGGVGETAFPHGGLPVAAVGRGFPPTTELPPGAVARLVPLFLACVGLPLCAFLAVAARMSARTRSRRLAALRLLGVPIRGARRVNAVEVGVLSAAGALLGVLLYPVVEVGVAGSGLLGVEWFPADTALTPTRAAVTVALTVGLALVVGGHSVRDALLSPFAARRGSAGRRPSAWELLPLAAGLVVLAVLAYVRHGAHGERGAIDSSHVLLAAVAVTGVGLLLAAAPLAARCGASMASRGPSLASRLGGARAAADPGGSSRLTAGVLVLVFASGVTIGFAEVSRTVTRPQRPIVQLSVDLAGVPVQAHAPLLRVPGTAAAVVIRTPMRQRRILLALVADCASLTRYVGAPLPDCRPGTSYAAGPLPPSRTLALPLGPDGALTLVPVPTRRLPPDVAAQLRPVHVVLARPAAAALRGEQGQLLLRTPRANLDATLAALVALAPYGQPDALGLDPADDEQLGIVLAVVRFGFGLGALVVLLAFAVAAVDRAAERRTADASLLVLGVSSRTLRRAQVWEVSLVMGVALAVAVGAGVLGSLAWQFTLGTDQSADTPALLVLCAAAAAAAGVGALVAAAVSTRSIDAAALRRD
jgi:hypothetical protein